ncbi:winged helix-turn-helix transcriptional regulator [Streptomyces sp. TRM66268-LWL]|uniref:Winged helix-turn-helix transcriptional regulator n=1 Tax=Streptomyces polyasparticus TaxID=2767826 RepID=A0ABR7SIE8_9ACTN|nr:winged helix-turn-helix domain-containing protein [Streptomyces polyasparticus]MBC9714752.1 winged helix-turn-helix transcriptional regulator [Streptomyces polyasparticus]
MEVLGVLRHRGRHPAAHARQWYADARRALPPGQLALLEALVPTDHSNAPDFLTPVPRHGESLQEVAARIAATPAEEADYQLDIAIRGRRVWPHVRALHESEAAYERWRRPMPPALESVARDGGAAVVSAAATAMATLFENVLAPDWPRVRTVLDADISNRADRMAAYGAAAVLDDLGERMQWTGTELVLERPYSGVIDWADEGVLFVPATTHVGPVLFAAEHPHPPLLIYRARGIAALGERPAGAAESALAGLVGVTRAALLTTLDTPASTVELSRRTGWSSATVSYHLGILLRAGLVDRSRRGRVVRYARTGLGTALATSSAEEQAPRPAAVGGLQRPFDGRRGSPERAG